jgi:hypothetical protein
MNARVIVSDYDDAYCPRCEWVGATDLVIDYDLHTSGWVCPKCWVFNETHHYSEGDLVA